MKQMDWERLISSKRLGMEDIDSRHRDDRSLGTRQTYFLRPIRAAAEQDTGFPLPGSGHCTTA